MIRAIPPHRILIFFVVGIVLGSVAWHVKWANIPKVFAAFQTIVPPQSQATAPGPRNETVELRRDRLRDEALAAGRKALAKPCDDATRAAYKDSLIELARQRMRDMGCMLDFPCNVEENGWKEASFSFYSTEKDRRVSRQMNDVRAAGGLLYGALGIYQVFVGHPQELANLGGMASMLDSACPDAMSGLPNMPKR